MTRSLLVAAGWLCLALTASAQPKAEPSTASATITLKDVDVGELLAKANVNLGYKVGGKVTVKASLTVELGDATSAKAYTIRGSVTSAELALEGMRVRDLSADVVYVDGKLTLTGLRATLPPDAGGTPGEIRGTATAAVEPRGDLVATLDLAAVPLGELFKALPGGLPVAGAVTGKAQFRSPLDDVSDPAKWVASADLSAGQLILFDRTVSDPKVKLAVADGRAKLTDVSAAVEGVPLTADATLALAGKFPFTATVRTQPREVGELQKLVPELEIGVPVRGKLASDSTITGTLVPFSVAASGSVSATELTAADIPGGKLSAKWAVKPERITVTDLSAEIFRGKLAGSVDVPRRADQAGDIKLTFADIDSGAVGKAFPKIPVRLTGQVSGTVAGTIPVAKPNQDRAVAADVTVTADRLTVQGIPAEKLTGKVSLEGTAVKYDLEGKALGGSFEVNGRYPEAKKEEPEGKGMLSLRRIDLARLVEALQLKGVPLKGRLDLFFEFSPDLQDGSGRYTFRGLGWGRSRFIPELGGRIRLRNGSFELVDSVGPVAGGTVRARVRASLEDPARNFFRFDVERADLGRLLQVFTDRPDLIEGGASLIVRGRLYPEFRATGSFGLTRGKVAGLTATDVRVPFTVTVRAGGGQVTVRDATGTIGNGRVTAHLESSWGASGRLTGQVKFTNVQVGNVLADLRQSNYFGSARVTGRIDLGGEGVRTSDDVTARVVMAIAQAGVRELPVLNTISPFVPPTAVLKPFDTGELRGRLARGVFRLERLTLANPTSDLYADGTIGLNGRLDLAVIVRTGQIGFNDAALQRVGLDVATILTPLPVRVIRAASDLLSNRTVRLTVTGTVDAPHPRVNAAALLTEEAIRYLLRQSVLGTTVPLPQVSPRTR
jgi:hypothetical protein